MIQKVEILKMVSKMAVSYAPKTYLTNILNKNNLILILSDARCYKMMQMIKMENWFDFRVEILKMASMMASKMATSKALKTSLTNKLNFDFLWLFRGLMIQTIKMEIWFGSEGSIFKVVSKMAAILSKIEPYCS